MYQVYQITMNDTIDTIANMFNISKNDLINLNSSISFMPGEYIVVPNSDNYDKYIVQKGDNIYKIAASYNMDPNMLILINGLNKDDYIYPNEVILLPKPGFNVYVTNENTTLNDLYQTGKIEDILKYNKTIYLLPNQTILFQKEN